ncbi:MAG: MFS transporter [Acidobacteria bacterium]|nr:MFS transporter [Acidobacteriota bacterium]
MFRKLLRSYREAFSGLPRDAWLIAAAEFVNRCGTMVLFFLVLYLKLRLGFSLPAAGTVLGAFGVGALAGAWLGGALCDRAGAVRVQVISLYAAGALFVLIGFLRDYTTLVSAVFLLGIFEEALHPAGATALVSACPPDLRTRAFALHRLAANAGVTVGPALGGVLAMVDYGLLFWVDGATCLAAGVLLQACFRGRTGRRPAGGAAVDVPAAAAARTPWRDPAFLCLALLIFGVSVVFCQLFGTFPLFLREGYGFPESAIGRLIAVNTVLIILTEMALTKALERRAPLPLVAAGVFLVGLGFSLMPLGSGSLFAALTVAVWTVGEMLSMPFVMGWVANRAGEGAQGAYMGVTSFCFALGLTVAAPLGTWAYARLGPGPFWAAVGALSALLAAGFLLLHRCTAAGPVETLAPAADVTEAFETLSR